ncbi:hypothetical protein EB001_16005, partial [bacterium]|nr:hypothetical protein [bacterium]
MSNECLICVKNQSARIGSTGTLKARVSMLHNTGMNFSAVSNIKATNSIRLFTKALLSGSASIKLKHNISFNTKALQYSGEAFIKGNLKLNHNIKQSISSISKVISGKVDKFAGYFNRINTLNFNPSEKLYPISDIVTNSGDNYFVDKYINSGNLYSNIDEGVFTGSYTKDRGISRIISDDRDSYIQPSSVFTKNNFTYKCEVTKPLHHAKESFLFIRAAAPVSDFASDIPPQYKIHNIKLEDPSGNLIIKYKNIILRGDADYKTNYVNF